VAFEPPDSRSLSGREDVALEPYLRALRRHPGTVAVIALATVGLTLLFLSVRAPSYEATAQLLVTPLPQGDTALLGLGLLRDSGDPTRTIQTAAGLVDNSRVAESLAKELGSDWTRDRVQNAIEVEPLGESNILAVTATAGAAQLAARIATRYALTSLAVRDRRLRRQVADALDTIGPSPSGIEKERAQALRSLRGRADPTLSLAQAATAPAGARGAPRWLVLALATIAGLTLGSLAALMLQRVARTVRDLADLLDVYPVPVLARVPPIRQSRAGPGEGPDLTAPPAVREAFRLLQMQLDPPSGDGLRTIMITSPSPRDGKTTSALNLALALVSAGHRVLLIDFDLRRPQLAARLGMDPDLGIASLVSKESVLGDALQSVPNLPTLQLLGAGIDGGSVLLEVLNRRMPKILSEAAAVADCVVIDTPPLGQVSDALRLVSYVDDLLVVARPGNTRRADLAQLRDLLQRAGRIPAGMVVLGDRDTVASTYYAYGEPASSGAPQKERLQPSSRR